MEDRRIAQKLHLHKDDIREISMSKTQLYFYTGSNEIFSIKLDEILKEDPHKYVKSVPSNNAWQIIRHIFACQDDTLLVVNEENEKVYYRITSLDGAQRW